MKEKIFLTSSKKFSVAEQAILTTLLYSDIFSFPLTEDELWRFLIAEKKLTKEIFTKSLASLNKYISKKDGYYCLKNREITIAHRIATLSEVTRKLQEARMVAEKLAEIPSILFIGVSGSLAVGNVTKNDDIDLVIITKNNTLFTSRLWILLLLERLGVRRFRNQKNPANTICVNLLFDDSMLAWPKEKQDVYIAREIAHILPLFERDNTYEKFLTANEWIKSFLPNVSFSKPFISRQFDEKISKYIATILVHPVGEAFFRKIQMSWIKRHQTRETVTKHVLAFHPKDYRTQTLERLRLKMRQLGLLTKF